MCDNCKSQKLIHYRSWKAVNTPQPKAEWSFRRCLVIGIISGLTLFAAVIGLTSLMR